MKRWATTGTTYRVLGLGELIACSTTLATASGGRFTLADEHKLAELLEERLGSTEKLTHAKVDHWPDWHRHPASDSLRDQLSTLWNTAALPSFLLFVALLSVEWYLRRRWGLV